MPPSSVYERYYRHGVWLQEAAWAWIEQGKKDCNKGSKTGKLYRKRWAAYALRNWRDGSYYKKKYAQFAPKGTANV